MKLLKKLNKIIVFSALAFTMFFSSTQLFAGSTGKISGTVFDGLLNEPLVGVNVIIKELTGYGAATDLDGKYVILNVPPGTYTVKFSMIGFKTVEISEVRVFIDRIIKVDTELEEESYEGEVVLVVATREAVEMDRTNTAAYVNSEEIEALPVTNLTEVIQLQSGVVKGADGALHIRGGRSREVAYMVDGIPVTNTFSQGGGSNVDVETDMVSELQVITGTFNAEYGSAQSGVINIVTKVPTGAKIDGNVEVRAGGYYAPDSPMYVGGVDNYDITNDTDLRFALSLPFNFSIQ